jgi:hypothetical protein
MMECEALEDPEDRAHIETIACEVHKKLPDVPWTFGLQASREHGALRRYAWIWVESPAEKAKQAGPRPVVTFTEHAPRPGLSATSTYTLAETVNVKVYGETYGAMARLARNFIAAAVNTCGPAFRLRSVLWAEEDGATQRNQLAVIRCAFLIPVVDEVFKLRAIGAYTDVCGTLQDDGTLKPQD